MKQNVDNENVEYILERIDNAVEHSFELWNTFDGFQRS